VLLEESDAIRSRSDTPGQAWWAIAASSTDGAIWLAYQTKGGENCKADEVSPAKKTWSSETAKEHVCQAISLRLPRQMPKLNLSGTDNPAAHLSFTLTPSLHFFTPLLVEAHLHQILVPVLPIAEVRGIASKY